MPEASEQQSKREANVHKIEPYSRWRSFYEVERDGRSPFYGSTLMEGLDNHVYNYQLHPAWDYFGSSTLYMKVLYTNYIRRTVVIELIGEWNDAIQNDIMFLKRDVLEPLMAEGIHRFVLIGENVLNYHASEYDDYYAEWYEEVMEEDGWIAAINFREHVRDEMSSIGITDYFLMNGTVIEWRTYTPEKFITLMDGVVTRRLGA